MNLRQARVLVESVVLVGTSIGIGHAVPEPESPAVSTNDVLLVVVVERL